MIRILYSVIVDECNIFRNLQLRNYMIKIGLSECCIFTEFLLTIWRYNGEFRLKFFIGSQGCHKQNNNKRFISKLVNFSIFTNPFKKKYNAFYIYIIFCSPHCIIVITLENGTVIILMLCNQSTLFIEQICITMHSIIIYFFVTRL
jgi:hypothetical protein